jgi:hypothetical protein
MSYRWRFNRMRPCDKARDPIQGEFFSAEAIDKPGEALVREGIQNSLDARRNGEKVMVRIRVSGTEAAVARQAIAPFLDGLDEHVKAPGNGLHEIPQDNDNCPFLVFEDIGTTGLIGDAAEWKPAAGSRNHFYYFFRAEGRFDKGEKDIGRWGVGKQVFLRASRINSIFGLTVRADDRKKMLMGMAVLKSHDVNGTRYAPDGWLGQPSEESDEDLVLPIEEAAFIDTFCKAFDIQRGTDAGLSIVVPWCDLDLTEDNLLRAVLRGYFWPILKGNLEVIVEAGRIETILDAKSMGTDLRRLGGDLEAELLPLVEMATWAVNLGGNEFITLNTAQGAWQWSPDLFPIDCLPAIREKYERGERIAFRVPVEVHEKNRHLRETFFDVFLVRDGSEQSGRPVFIRGGIIIPDVGRNFARALRGVRSLVVAEDPAMASFVGDSENPAHTQWQKDGANFKGVYGNGANNLNFVIRSASEILCIICEQDKKEDRTLLSDLFSIPAPPEPPESRRREKKKSGGPGKEPEVPPLPEPRPRQFAIDRIQGGFVVRNGDDGAAPPKSLLIRAAYQVRRGNPFKKYHPADFDFCPQVPLLARMKVCLEGATVLEQKENRLKVRISGEGFRIEVVGFDPKRDVRVEVKRQEDENAGSDN